MKPMPLKDEEIIKYLFKVENVSGYKFNNPENYVKYILDKHLENLKSIVTLDRTLEFMKEPERKQFVIYLKYIYACQMNPNSNLRNLILTEINLIKLNQII